MTEYYKQDGTEYVPQEMDVMEGEKTYITSGTTEIIRYRFQSPDFKVLDEKRLVGISFNSFYELANKFSFDRLGERISFFDGAKNYSKKEDESLEEFFLRVAVETKLLFKK